MVRVHLYVKIVLLAPTRTPELWTIFHDELDLDGNGRLDSEELALALGKAGESVHQALQHFSDHHTGITLSPPTLVEFMTTLTSSSHSHSIRYEIASLDSKKPRPL